MQTQIPLGRKITGFFYRIPKPPVRHVEMIRIILLAI